MAKVKWLIKYGVGGGYNDTENYAVVEAETEEGASNEAWSKAIEVFDSYDVEGFGIEAGQDEDEEGFNEERESWLEYSAELYDEEKHKDIELG